MSYSRAFFQTAIFLFILSTFSQSQDTLLTAKEGYHFVGSGSTDLPSDVYAWQVIWIPNLSSAYENTLDTASGKARTWDIAYYSPSMDSVYRVHVSKTNGTFAAVVTSRSILDSDTPEPIGSGWIDSPQFLKLALAGEAGAFLHTEPDAKLYSIAVTNMFWVISVTTGTEMQHCVYLSSYGQLVICETQLVSVESVPVAETLRIDVFPNPLAMGHRAVKIQILGGVGAPVSINVYDILGRAIFHTSSSNLPLIGDTYTLDLPVSMVPGIYFVNVIAGNRSQTDPLVVIQ